MEMASVGRLINLTNASMQLFAPDPYRWSIAIAAPTSGTAWLISDTVASNGNGFQLANNTPTLLLDRYSAGGMIGKAWNIIHTAGGVTIYVVETLILPGGICGNYLKREPGEFLPGSNRGQPQGPASAKSLAANL